MTTSFGLVGDGGAKPEEAAGLAWDWARFYWRRIFLEWHKIQGIKS